VNLVEMVAMEFHQTLLVPQYLVLAVEVVELTTKPMA
jgi:hypothetical protein